MSDSNPTLLELAGIVHEELEMVGVEPNHWQRLREAILLAHKNLAAFETFSVYIMAEIARGNIDCHPGWHVADAAAHFIRREIAYSELQRSREQTEQKDE